MRTKSGKENNMRVASSHLSWAPASKVGRWSIWLEVAFVLLFVINIAVNLYVIRPNAAQQSFPYMLFVISMLICGVTGGVIGLIAVTKQHEHSFLVWLSILCGLFVLLLILNELLQGIRYWMGV